MYLFSLVLTGKSENFDPVIRSFYECMGNLLQLEKNTTSQPDNKLPIFMEGLLTLQTWEFPEDLITFSVFYPLTLVLA